MQEKTKQETASEGFHRISKEFDYSEFDFVSFKIGIEWQQGRSYSEKQMDDAYDKGFKDASEKRYSEEEVFKLIEKAIEDKWANLRYWFEQFKKK